MREPLAKAAMLGCALLLFSCGEQRATVQLDCHQGEVSAQIEFSDPGNDVLLIVEPELAEQLRPRLLPLLRALVTGEVDDVEGKDVWVASSARVGVVSPSAAQQLLAQEHCAELAQDPTKCAQLAPPFVRYRWAPYGYADDADAFADNALCLLGPDPSACASAPESGEIAFGSNVMNVWLITTHDSCDSFGDEQGCDQRLTALVHDWTEHNRTPSSAWWWPTLIAGAPVEVASLPAFVAAESRGAYLRKLESDPRMLAERGADACEGNGRLVAEPARELVRSFGDLGDGVLSVCADDYRPALQMVDCTGFADSFAQGFDPERLQLSADGLGVCDFDELLPAKGPITHCAQLADFGRAPEPVSMEGGREWCRLDQLNRADGEAGRGFGWYLEDGNSKRLVPEPQPPCRGFLGGYGLMPTFALGTDRIPSSSVRVRCATAASGTPSCDDAAERDAGR